VRLGFFHDGFLEFGLVELREFAVLLSEDVLVCLLVLPHQIFESGLFVDLECLFLTDHLIKSLLFLPKFSQLLPFVEQIFVRTRLALLQVLLVQLECFHFDFTVPLQFSELLGLLMQLVLMVAKFLFFSAALLLEVMELLSKKFDVIVVLLHLEEVLAVELVHHELVVADLAHSPALLL